MTLKKIQHLYFIKIFSLVLILTFFACEEVKNNTTDKEKNNSHSVTTASRDTIKFSINGQITNTQSTSIRLDKLEMGKVIHQSELDVSNGIFSYEGNAKEAALYQLTFAEGQIPLFITGGDIEIIIDGIDISNYKLKGPKESIEVRVFFEILTGFNQEAQKLRNRLMNSPNQEAAIQLRDSIPFYQEELNLKRSQTVIEFIERNKGSVTTLLAANYLDVREYPDLVSGLYDDFKEKYRNHALLIQLKEQIDQYIHLANGRIAPEIELVTPDGETIKLSSLKGKYVFIDFWAAWCKPCRDEHPHLKKLYDQYKNKNFEIYAVNLDDNKEAWLQAIKQDNINWLQVADPKMPGMQAEIAQTYRITHIPNTYLLDTEGRIIARDLRGEALTQKLKELL